MTSKELNFFLSDQFIGGTGGVTVGVPKSQISAPMENSSQPQLSKPEPMEWAPDAIIPPKKKKKDYKAQRKVLQHHFKIRSI